MRAKNYTGIQYDLLAGYWISYVSPPDLPCSGTTLYQDNDQDGFGNSGVTQTACTHPPGFVGNNTDCDDNDGEIYPGNGCEKAMPWINLLLTED